MIFLVLICAIILALLMHSIFLSSCMYRIIKESGVYYIQKKTILNGEVCIWNYESVPKGGTAKFQTLKEAKDFIKQMKKYDKEKRAKVIGYY